MKRFAKLLSLLFVACSLTACSCSKESTINSTLENSTNVISGSKVTTGLTTQDIYKYIRENEVEDVNKIFLTYLMSNVLNIESSTSKKTTYNLKIKQHFEDNYLNKDEYKVNGVFNEEVLASTLETQLYIVDKVNKPTSGATVELGLEYNYSDYINRKVNYDIYMEMLKEDYILTNKKSVLDNSRTRIISIYTAEDVEEAEEIVEGLFEGEYTNLKEIADSKIEDAIKDLGMQYCQQLGLENDYYEGTCSASQSSSTYDSALYKFTVCENGERCSPNEGLEYLVAQERKKVYVSEQVVNKNTTDVLYTEALEQLLRSDVEDYLHKVIDGQDYFLVNGLYNEDEEFSNKDIILSSGPDSECYLVTVRVVDSNSTNPLDKEQALSLLLDKVSETAVLIHYLEDLDVEVTDPAIAEYYNTLKGNN